MDCKIIKDIFQEIYKETSTMIKKVDEQYEELTDPQIFVHTRILHNKFSKIETEVLKYEKARK